MMDEEMIEACPFCRSEAHVSDGGAGLAFQVICGNRACLATGPRERCAIDARDTWNTRAAHSVIAGQIAELEGALIKARDKFRHYAIQHEAKARAANPGGSERSMSGEAADRWAKAQSNREMAEMCDAALAQTKGTDR